MLIAGLGCAFWQQATGVEAAVYYTPETLEAAGIQEEGHLLLATVGVGLIKVAQHSRPHGGSSPRDAMLCYDVLCYAGQGDLHPCVGVAR